MLLLPSVLDGADVHPLVSVLSGKFSVHDREEPERQGNISSIFYGGF